MLLFVSCIMTIFSCLTKLTLTYLPLKSKVALSGKGCQKGVPNIAKAAKKVPRNLWLQRLTIMCFFRKNA